MRPCPTCTRPTAKFRRGECDRCYSYRKRNGVARPFGPDNQYAFTPERRERWSRERNPGWKGDDATPSALYYRTRDVFPIDGLCRFCGNTPADSRHHWNLAPADNTPGNLVPCCRSCHGVVHAWGYV